MKASKIPRRSSLVLIAGPLSGWRKASLYCHTFWALIFSLKWFARKTIFFRLKSSSSGPLSGTSARVFTVKFDDSIRFSIFSVSFCWKNKLTLITGLRNKDCLVGTWVRWWRTDWCLVKLLANSFSLGSQGGSTYKSSETLNSEVPQHKKTFLNLFLDVGRPRPPPRPRPEPVELGGATPRGPLGCCWGWPSFGSSATFPLPLPRPATQNFIKNLQKFYLRIFKIESQSEWDAG